jgi:hypothetical protein
MLIRKTIKSDLRNRLSNYVNAMCVAIRTKTNNPRNKKKILQTSVTNNKSARALEHQGLLELPFTGK